MKPGAPWLLAILLVRLILAASDANPSSELPSRRDWVSASMCPKLAATASTGTRFADVRMWSISAGPMSRLTKHRNLNCPGFVASFLRAGSCPEAIVERRTRGVENPREPRLLGQLARYAASRIATRSSRLLRLRRTAVNRTAPVTASAVRGQARVGRHSVRPAATRGCRKVGRAMVGGRMVPVPGPLSNAAAAT